MVLWGALAFAATQGGVASARLVSASDHLRADPARARVSTLPERVILLGLSQGGNPAKFASQVSDPSSPLYRRFLSLRQYQERFSPPRAERRAVVGYLASQRGVLKVQLGSDESVVLAVVTAQAGQRIFCARGAKPPTGGLCTPHALRPWVREISAGELYQGAPAPPSGRGGRREPEQAKAASSQVCAAASKTGGFTPPQLSTAYGVGLLRSRGLDGSGVRVATLSSQLIGTSQFQTWAQCFGFRTPVVRQFSMPSATVDTQTPSDETALDVEALATLAPGLQQITPIFVPLDRSFSHSFLLFMFGALDPSRQGGRLPNILSISDGFCESQFTRDQLRLGERLLAQAAALGITTLAASGDSGFDGCFVGSEHGVFFPASSPFVTGVGGTALTLTPGDQIAAQVVWSTFATTPSQGAGSGGGRSTVWPRPSFQLAPGIGPRLQTGKTTRLVPDIAANASFTPGLATYFSADQGWGSDGGTSTATPLEAAVAALVLEQERKARRPPLGSLNPLLYELARGAQYHSIFYDITTGTSSRQPHSAVAHTPAGGAAQPGYDLATGLGSLNAAAFAHAVASHQPRRTP